MSTTYTNEPIRNERDTYHVRSDGRAHFSGLDITAFFVGCVMLLAPLAMAAYGAWTTPAGL